MERIAASDRPARGAPGILWAPVLTGTGIGLYFLLPAEPPAGAFAALLAGAAALVLAGRRGPPAARGGAIAVAFVLAGLALAGIRSHAVAAPVLAQRYYGPVEGRVVDTDRSFSDAIRLTLDRVVLPGLPPEATPRRVRVALHGEAAGTLPPPGARIALSGHLAPPEGPVAPGGFDFRRRAWFEGLGGVGYTRSPVVRIEAPAEGMALAAFRARIALSAGIRAAIPGQPGALAAAFMTGDRSAVDAATNEAMRNSNLSHMISISGLHMGLLVGFVFGLVRTGLALIPAVLLRVPAKKIAAAVALVAAAAYLALAGPDVATERAFIMAAVMLVAVLIGRRAISLRSLAAAALIVLVLEPESLVDPGFQMSFAATLALILAHRPWTAVQDRVHPLLRPAVLLVIASLAAGAATGPIAAIHFNRIAGYGLLANLLANPVMGLLVMPSGVIAALVAPLGLEALPLWLMGQGCRAILAIAYWVAGLGGAVTAVPTPPGAVLPLMAAGACLAVLARRTPRLAGAAAVAAALALWAAADRPAVLVAQDGGIVGIMTAEGRALSRESGAGFVAATWLEDDGDLADQAAAYARPGFRHAGTLSAAESPLRIRHLRGKGARERAAPLCRDGAILVLAEPWEVPPGADCTAYDTRSLRESGSLAISADGQVTTAQEVAGDRLWSRPGTARPDRFQ